MKANNKFKLNWHPIVIGVLGILMIISSCKGGDDSPPPPTDQEVAEALLISSWNLGSSGSITVDNTVVTDRYDGFSITFEKQTYSTANAGDLFPASGTWQWVGESDNMLITGSGKDITINTLNETTLSIQFIKTDQNAAAGVSGNYSVELSK